MGFVAMVVPVGSWRFTSEPDENWTQAALSTMTSRECFDVRPSEGVLVDSFQARLDCLIEQVRDEQTKQARATGFVTSVQHFELYLFNEEDAPTRELFMAFIDGTGRLEPLDHIRFDRRMAMSTKVPQPS